MKGIIIKGIFILAVVTGVSKCAYDTSQAQKYSRLYTESLSEARAFSRECSRVHHGLLQIKEYPIKSWLLSCQWTEE